MRRIHFYSTLIIMLAAGCCFTACKKDESTEGKKLNLVIGSFVPEADQKLYLDEENLPRWAAGDTLLLAEGNSAAADAIVHYTGEKAEVSAKDASKDDFYAVYPAGGSSVTSAGGSVVVPTIQDYRVDASGNQILPTPMAACLHGKSGSLFFRNLASVVKVVVSNYNLEYALTVYEVSVIAHEDDNYLAGTLDFTFPEGVSTSATQNVSCTLNATAPKYKTATLFCGEDGIKIEKGASKEFYIVVNSFSTSDKLSFTINGASEYSYANFTLNQNVGRTLAPNRIGTQHFASSFDDGIPYGIFTSSPTTKVEFAPGNLQFRASDTSWRFAPQQNTIVAWDNSNQHGNARTRANGRYTSSDWIDLLRWGGTCCKARNMPCLTNDYANPPTAFEKPESAIADLNGTNYDYGYYCNIYNPRSGNTNAPGTWRMPKGKERGSSAGEGGEYYYMMNMRTTHTYGLGESNANAKFVFVYVDGLYGAIIFPDVYTHPIGVSIPEEIDETGFSRKVLTRYSMREWKLMELAGCVFLPACGHTVDGNVLLDSGNGYYYTSTSGTTQNPYSLEFDQAWSWNSNVSNNHKSVRLVRDVSIK